MRFLKLLLAAALAIAVCACSDLEPAVASDAGAGWDSSVSSPDAQAQPDAGVPVADASSIGPLDGSLADASARPLPAVPLRTSSRWIVDQNGARVKLASVNWYGAESPDFVVAGLHKQSLASIARQIREMGFNSVRLPYSNQMVEENPYVDARFLAGDPSLQGKRALEIYDAVIEALAFEGLMVIIDDHVSRADWCCSDTDGNGLWYADGYPESAWIADWKFMVQRYKNQPAVVGAELRNELRRATVGGVSKSPVWGGAADVDWRAAAIRGGEAVLAENPDLLIFVDGIDYSKDLSKVWDNPIVLSVPNRVVYAPHEYSWFYNAKSYEELKTKLGNAWGFILMQGKPFTAPVWVGEWGAAHTAQGVNSAWFGWFVQYLSGQNADIDWAYWALNGTQSSGYGRTWDTAEDFGILDVSWSQPAYGPHLDTLKAIQAPVEFPQ